MSADCSETTHLLGGNNDTLNITINRMADNTRQEEEFYRENSPWGQFTKKHRYPSLLFTIYLIVSLLIPVSINMIIGVWALLKALKYFPIATQPATIMIIISAVIIVMTVVMVLFRFVAIITCRFESASINGSVYMKLEILSVVVSIIVMVLLDIVTITLTIIYEPDANTFSASSSFDNYFNNQAIRETWDMAQEDLKCCGLDSFTDYDNHFNNLSVPMSCCNTTHPLVNQSTCPEIVTNVTLASQTGQIYTEGNAAMSLLSVMCAFFVSICCECCIDCIRK